MLCLRLHSCAYWIQGRRMNHEISEILKEKSCSDRQFRCQKTQKSPESTDRCSARPACFRSGCRRRTGRTRGRRASRGLSGRVSTSATASRTASTTHPAASSMTPGNFVAGNAGWCRDRWPEMSPAYSACCAALHPAPVGQTFNSSYLQ